jgi:hypothetical protein
MSHAHPRADREYDHDHANQHPALTPLVIDVIPDQTQAELEESIDAPLVVERFERDRDSEKFHSHTVGNVGAGRTFDTRAELRAEYREQTDRESGSDAASDSGGDYYD